MPKMYGASTAAAASVGDELRLAHHSEATSMLVRWLASANELWVLHTATWLSLQQLAEVARVRARRVMAGRAMTAVVALVAACELEPAAWAGM